MCFSWRLTISSFFPAWALARASAFSARSISNACPGFDHRGQFGFQGGKRFVAGIGAIGFERILNRLVEFAESGLFFLIHLRPASRGRRHAGRIRRPPGLCMSPPGPGCRISCGGGGGGASSSAAAIAGIIPSDSANAVRGRRNLLFIILFLLLFRHLPDLFSRNLFN